MTSPKHTAVAPAVAPLRVPPARRRRPRGTVARAIPVYLLLLGGAVITLAPLVLSIVTAFTSPGQFARSSGVPIPDPWTLENFLLLFTGRAEIGRAIGVTVAMTVVIALGQLFFSILAAYAFARIRFPGREFLFWTYLSGLMVPAIVQVIPLYLMFTQAGLRNTFWALVVPFVLGSPYAIFLLREYFRGIPVDLVDAARLDGAGHGRILALIIVPLSRPIIVTLLLITVVSQWNSFLWPQVSTTGTDVRVLTVATATLQGEHNDSWTVVMAATTLALVPLVALFLVFQKQILRSITITGFK